MTHIEVAPAPEWSCLQVARLKDGSGHVLCAHCGEPIAVIDPDHVGAFSFICFYSGGVPWDEYISATVELELPPGQFAYYDRLITAHQCKE